MTRRAFSLVELMMGTIILGLGLLIVGAVLPIAWRGSIETSALTRHEGSTAAAKNQVERKVLVDCPLNLFSSFNVDAYSPLLPADSKDDPEDLGISYHLLGDYKTRPPLPNPDPAVPEGPDNQRPRYVHALHVENWPVSSDETLFLSAGSKSLAVPEAPILIDRLTWERNAAGEDPFLVGTPFFIGVTTQLDPLEIVGQPVVRFRDRVFPPILGDWPDLIDDNGTDIINPQMRDVLASRRFAWAVFHRLARNPASISEPRTFMMYYVTLNRGNDGNRYARQDNLSFPLTNQGPQAQSSGEDVRFPIAWRVPLVLLPSVDPLGEASGVPGVAYVGDVAGLMPAPFQQTSPIHPDCHLPEMFPAGAYFIDDLSGAVYRVADREFLNVEGTAARLNLDRDVFPVDLGPGIDEERAERVVWVFPPPVLQSDRNSGDPVTFGGHNPVVEIRVEPLTILPNTIPSTS